MANETQEKKTFKYGDQEYALDDLLKLHTAQENNFYNFAKTRGQYDDEALLGLRKALTARINAAKEGKAFSGDGILDGDVVDNIQIQTQKKGLFKKDKYVDQDNTEWAKYYFNKLMSQLKPHQKQENKGNWDINKHGFQAYLTGQGINAKDVFEGMDVKSTDNPEEKRAFTQRYNSLRTHLQGYNDWLKSKNFDFTKNDNEWDDDFMSTLDNLINNADWSDSNQLSASLRKLGAGDAYTTAFTSDRWDSSKTSEESKAEAEANAEKKKQEEARKSWDAEKRRRYGIYSGLSDLRSAQIQKYAGADRLFEMTDEDIDSHESSVGVEDEAAAKKYWDNLDTKYLKNPYDVTVSSIMMPMRARRGLLKSIDSGDYSGWQYDPSTINEERQSVAAIDPITGKIEEIFLGNLKNEWGRIKTKYMRDNNYTDPLAAYDKEGGILEFQTGGAMTTYDYLKERKKEKNKLKAEETGNSEEVQKARDRVVSNGDDSFVSDKRTLANPDAGFTGADIARLVSIGADITSIFLDPVTGTAVGLGSTLTNFGADIADDGFQWEDVKNLGINAGFDLLGAIPLFGDALGTGTKITRQLAKWAPRVMAGLAAYQGVANFDGIMNSFGKFVSGDKDQKLTVQDWRNIAQGIGLVTGGTRAIKNKAAQSKMKKQARVDDVVGVTVVDKNGVKQQVLVDGDVAKRIRAAEGVKDKVETELATLDQFKDKFGENGTLSVETRNNGGFRLNPFQRHKNADSSKGDLEWRGFRKEGRAAVDDVYDWSRVRGYSQSKGYRIPGVSDWLNNQHQALINRLNNGTPPSQINLLGADEIANLRKDQNGKAGVDTEIANIKKSMEARTKAQERIKQQLAPEKKKLKELHKKLNGVADETTLTGNIKQLETDLAALEIQINDRTKKLNTAQKNLDKLVNKQRIKDPVAHSRALQSARGRVRGHQAVLSGHNAKKSRLNTQLDQANQNLQTWGEFNPTQANVKRLNDANSKLSSSNHTNAYNRLQQLLQNLQTNHSTIRGRQVSWDMQDILKQAGIQNAFKEGGSINRNKINKFINYAKG